jgi:hypothetical protein
MPQNLQSGLLRRFAPRNDTILTFFGRIMSAILADVDILVTGDKGFHDIDIERPEILSPAGFLAKY